jgi:transposase-like protein
MEKQTKFPKTLLEAIKYFADPDNALNLMVKLRWPDGITCPYCESKEYSFISTRQLWKCKSCKKQFRVKVGTIMEDSPIGLDKWLSAMWMIVNCKNGISSYEIHRALGITQKSAWFLLHRIRLAMQTGSFKLCGGVEADETFIGGKARNMHKTKREKMIQGRGGVGKTIVMGAVERGGRVSATVVPNRDEATLQGALRERVEHGSILFTDAWTSYVGLYPDFVHKVINHAEKYVEGNIHTNGIENFWSLLKRGLKGTYVSVMPFHLFRYVDEQAFRFNNRKSNDATRFLLVAKQISGRRLTYNKLLGKGLMRDEAGH